MILAASREITRTNFPEAKPISSGAEQTEVLGKRGVKQPAKLCPTRCTMTWF